MHWGSGRYQEIDGGVGGGVRVSRIIVEEYLAACKLVAKLINNLAFCQISCPLDGRTELSSYVSFGCRVDNDEEGIGASQRSLCRFPVG